MKFGWVKKHKLPILYVDPMPELGGYYNQRFMLNAFPRPVWWMPSNWILVPIATVISFAIHVREALRDASNHDRGDG